MLEITLANLCSTNALDTAELPKGNGNKGRPLNAQDNLTISDLSGSANLGIRSLVLSRLAHPCKMQIVQPRLSQVRKSTRCYGG